MIKQGDILMYSECLEVGDEYSLALAVEDEATNVGIPMVRVRELNTNLPLPPENFYEASNFKVVGHLQEGEDNVAVVRRLLPQNKWIYTDDLLRENFK